MTEQAKRLAAVLREHLPKDRYDDDGVPTGTFCTGCDWQGGYFADGEAGPFDDHLAAAILASDWLADYVSAELREALAEEWERLRADDTLAYASRCIADLRAALHAEPAGEDAP